MKKSAHSGITLIELIVAVAVGAILVAGAFRMYVHFVKNNAVQRNISQMQSELTVATQAVERDFRMAGYGVPGNGLRITLNSTTPDAAGIFFREDTRATTLSADAPAGQAFINATSLSDVDAGTGICIINGSTHELARATGKVPAESKILLDGVLQNAFPAGPTVWIATRIKYEISGGNFTREFDARSSIMGTMITGFDIHVLRGDDAEESANFDNGVRVRCSIYGDAKKSGNPFIIRDTIEVNLRNSG